MKEETEKDPPLPVFLSKEHSMKLKGFAIFMIVLHNYFHLIYTKSKENEMDFYYGRFISYLAELSLNPLEILHGTFTFFGHFGVQIFIFLSAYGLAQAYANVSHKRIQFLISRIRKIYPCFILAILLWIVLDAVWNIGLYNVSFANEVNATKRQLLDVAKVLLGIHNWFPGHRFPVVGPWWFIPYIVQFYILWALFADRITRLGKTGFIVLGGAGIVANYTLTPWIDHTLSINLLYSPFGHIPEIAFGAYCAKYGLHLPKKLVIYTAVVFICSSLSVVAWPFHHISALVLFLWLGMLIANTESPLISRLACLLGFYSMPLFFVNGFMRPPFILISKLYGSWYIEIIAAVILLACCVMVSMLLSRIEHTIFPKSSKR